MKRVLYTLCQWTWGLPQNLLGAAIYLFYRVQGCAHFRYQGAKVLIWPQRAGSMSMGSFLFMHPSWTPKDKALLEHEYGHTIQSLFFGPLYLLSVGLPSVIWASVPALDTLRRKKQISYYSVYPEKWASSLGARFAKKAVPMPKGRKKPPAPVGAVIGRPPDAPDRS